MLKNTVILCQYLHCTSSCDLDLWPETVLPVTAHMEL